MKRFYGISAAQHQRLFALNLCAARRFAKKAASLHGWDLRQRRKKKNAFACKIAADCARISSWSTMFASIRWHKDEA